MKTPIVANNKGDVTIFFSVKDAENYIEVIDVLNEEYVVYDCEGRLIEMEIVKIGKRQKIHLYPKENLPNHVNELINVLIQFLHELGYALQNLQSHSLEKLIDLTIDNQ